MWKDWDVFDCISNIEFCLKIYLISIFVIKSLRISIFGSKSHLISSRISLEVII